MEIGSANAAAWHGCWGPSAMPRRVDRCEHEADATSGAGRTIGRVAGSDRDRPEVARIGDLPPVDVGEGPGLRLVRVPVAVPGSGASYGPGWSQGGVPAAGSLIDVIA